MDLKHLAPWIFGCLCVVSILSVVTTIPWILNSFGLLPMVIIAIVHMGVTSWAGYKCVQAITHILIDKDY